MLPHPSSGPLPRAEGDDGNRHCNLHGTYEGIYREPLSARYRSRAGETVEGKTDKALSSWCFDFRPEVDNEKG